MHPVKVKALPPTPKVTHAFGPSSHFDPAGVNSGPKGGWASVGTSDSPYSPPEGWKEKVAEKREQFKSGRKIIGHDDEGLPIFEE